MYLSPTVASPASPVDPTGRFSAFDSPGDTCSLMRPDNRCCNGIPPPILVNHRQNYLDEIAASRTRLFASLLRSRLHSTTQVYTPGHLNIRPLHSAPRPKETLRNPLAPSPAVAGGSIEDAYRQVPGNECLYGDAAAREDWAILGCEPAYPKDLPGILGGEIR